MFDKPTHCIYKKSRYNCNIEKRNKGKKISLVPFFIAKLGGLNRETKYNR